MTVCHKMGIISYILNIERCLIMFLWTCDSTWNTGLKLWVFVKPRMCNLNMIIFIQWQTCLKASVCFVYRFITWSPFWLQLLLLPASVCVCLSVCLSVNHLLLIAITQKPFKLGSPNLGERCQSSWLRSLFLWIDRTWSSRSYITWKSKFTLFWACPHHNSSPHQTRITKFGPDLQNTLDKIPIVYGGNRPWPSMSNLI